MMEEEILGIIKTNQIFLFGHSESCAKEIASHITDFIRWKDFGKHSFVPWYDEIDGKIENYYTDDTDDLYEKHWSLDDLYQYWKEKIYKDGKRDQDKFQVKEGE